MKPSRSWIVYTIMRVVVFVVPLVVLLIIGVNPFISTAGAALIGLCLSYIFLRRPRDEVAKAIAARRNTKDRDRDNEVENELLDRFEQDGRD